MNDVNAAIGINIVATGAQTGAQQVNAALDSIQQRGRGATSAVQQVQNALNAVGGGGLSSASSEATRLTQSLGGVGKASSAANDNMKTFGGSLESTAEKAKGMVEHLGKAALAVTGLAFAAQGAHILIEKLTELSDDATEVASRLAVVTNSSHELAAAQKNVAAIAGQARASITGTAELYQKIGIQADHLGLSQGGVTMATKTFAETLKIAGATQQQAAGSMRQLGEAFDIGKLSGVHYQAMMADNIVFMKLLAQSMGVPIGKMKEMSTEGKVTAEDLKKALTDPKLAEDIQKRFDKMPTSFADVRTSIHNTLVQLAGDFADGAGLNGGLKGLYDKINGMADNLAPSFVKIGQSMRSAFDGLAPIFSATFSVVSPLFSFLLDHGQQVGTLFEVVLIPVASRLAVLYGTELLAAVYGFGGAAVTSFLAAASAEGVLAASTAALGTALNGVMSLFGGPVGVAIAALGTGLYMLASRASTARDKVDELAKASNSAAGGTGDTGLKALEAARGVQTFGGKAGEAAGKLWDMASAARSAAIETAKLALTKARADYDTAFGQTGQGLAKRQSDAAAGFNREQSVGDRLHSIGSFLGARYDYLTSDVASRNKAVAATHVAAGRVRAAQATYNETVNKPAEAFIPKPVKPEKPLGDDDDDKKDKKAQREKEFWQTLQNEVETAKLFGLQQQQVTKEQELQKILGRDLTDSEKGRVDNLVATVAAQKAITSLKQATFEVDNKTLLAGQRQTGLTEQQAKVQDALDAKKLEALNAGVDITTKDYQTALAAYQVALEHNQAIDARNQLLKTGQEIAKRYAPTGLDADMAGLAMDKKKFQEAFATGDLKDAWGKPLTKVTADAIIAGIDQAMKNKPLEGLASYTGQGSLARQNADIAKVDADHKKALASVDAMTGLDDATRQQYLLDIANTYRDDMARASSEVADDLAKKVKDRFDRLGDLLGTIGGLVGGKAGAAIGQAGNVTKAFGSFATSQKQVSDTIAKAFDPNGGPTSFAAKVGDKVGGAVAGLGIGSEIGKLGSALGLKGTETGAKIGGTIGGLALGPLGALGGSILGGLFSSLFYKPPSSNASFQKNADGTVGVGSVTGSNATVKAAASGAAGEVLSGLSKIASSIGGTLTGTPNLTIGTWDSKWRVLDNQQTSEALHSKNFSMGSNLHDFGSDEASAVAYAISEALKQGVITGLGELAQKALGALDADSAVSFIQSWSSAMSDFKSITDPIGSAVEGVVTPLQTLLTTMTKVGASTTDLTKLDEYRAAKLDQVYKQQTSSFQAILDNLLGSAGGSSPLARLNSDMAKFAGYQSDLKAGKAIDQSDYSSLISKLLSDAGNVYDTSSSQYQSIIGQVQGLTTDIMGSIKAQIDTAAGTTGDASAQIAASNAIASQVSIGNDYASQQVALLQAISDKLDGGNGSYAVNGVSLVSY